MIVALRRRAAGRAAPPPSRIGGEARHRDFLDRLDPPECAVAVEPLPSHPLAGRREQGRNLGLVEIGSPGTPTGRCRASAGCYGRCRPGSHRHATEVCGGSNRPEASPRAIIASAMRSVRRSDRLPPSPRWRRARLGGVRLVAMHGGVIGDDALMRVRHLQPVGSPTITAPGRGMSRPSRARCRHAEAGGLLS